jgi:cytochrome c biogenesis protein CcmG, thiol:disulfide interchange protein DsbE
MKRWIPIAALVPFAALVGVSVWLLTRPEPGPMTFSSPERAAPDFDLASLDGGRVTLAELRGRPVLVNFWGSYCAPCKIEHPLLMEMAGEGVEIVGVLYKDPDIDAAKGILVDDGNPFSKVAVDPIGDFGLEVGISGVPETFLINAQGMIVKALRGPISNEHQAKDFADAWKAEAAKTSAPAAS